MGLQMGPSHFSAESESLQWLHWLQYQGTVRQSDPHLAAALVWLVIVLTRNARPALRLA